MPCNQMISMNCRPPRPIEDISPARLPIPNEADRNSRMSTIGDSTRSSMKQNATREKQAEERSTPAPTDWSTQSSNRHTAECHT